MTVNGISDDNSLLIWDMGTEPWNDCKIVVNLKKDETQYQFSKSFDSSVEGFKNLGYIDSGSTGGLEVTVNKITINDDYVLETMDGRGDVWIMEHGS